MFGEWKKKVGATLEVVKSLIDSHNKAIDTLQRGPAEREARLLDVELQLKTLRKDFNSLRGKVYRDPEFHEAKPKQPQRDVIDSLIDPRVLSALKSDGLPVARHAVREGEDEGDGEEGQSG